jgi:hypothetical protein
MKTNEIKGWLLKNKKPLTILTGIIILNSVFGFDARFTLINLLWLLV